MSNGVKPALFKVFIVVVISDSESKYLMICNVAEISRAFAIVLC
jgi:hypothetical protein